MSTIEHEQATDRAPRRGRPPRDTRRTERAPGHLRTTAYRNEGNPALLEGDTAIDAEPLSLERFAVWARYLRIGMRFGGLGDRQGKLRWDVARVLGVGRSGLHFA